MHTYPQYSKRTVLSLNGIWDFAFLGDTVNPEALDIAAIVYGDRMAVPGAFDATPSYLYQRGTAAYRTRFRVPAGRRAKLAFNGIGMWGRIYVDGRLLLEQAQPYSTFACPVPVSDKEDRELVILINNEFNYERAPLQEWFFDFYAYGGLFRDVALHILPDTWIESVRVTPRRPAEGAVDVAVELGGDLSGNIGLTFRFDEGAWETAAAGRNDRGGVQFAARTPNPRLWSPDHPNLHTLTVRLAHDDLTVRFGLRSLATEKGMILINGRPVKLKGINRHEAHPQFGPALPAQQLVADVQLLKEMGVNFVRGSHYPQDPRFLDLCDEAGLLVWEESIGWQQNERSFTSDKYHRLLLGQTREMIRSGYNHPAIILWGFLNEAQSHLESSKALYAQLVALCRQEDPTRLVTYASNRGMADLSLEIVDVISINTYPGWYSQEREAARPLDEVATRLATIVKELDARGLGSRPLIISEIGAGAIYGWRDQGRNYWSEEYQADLIEAVCDAVLDNERFAGLAIWQFCDGKTYNNAFALGRPRSFNNKGVVDEYRRPKLAFETVKRRYGKG